jgi:hypothetical protein
MAGYRRHELEQTLLYKVVAAELDGLRESLAAASAQGAGLPRHVDKELEAPLALCRCRRQVVLPTLIDSAPSVMRRAVTTGDYATMCRARTHQMLQGDGGLVAGLMST